MRRAHIPAYLFATAIVVWSEPPAAAQDLRSDSPEFQRLAAQVRLGDRLRVTDNAGEVTSGRLTALSPASFEIRVGLAEVPKVFEPAGVERVQRVGDPVWNGVLIGAGVGLLSGGARMEGRERVQLAAGLALWGGIIDAAVRGRKTVYEKPVPTRAVGLSLTEAAFAESQRHVPARPTADARRRRDGSLREHPVLGLGAAGVALGLLAGFVAVATDTCPGVHIYSCTPALVAYPVVGGSMGVLAGAIWSQID